MSMRSALLLEFLKVYFSSPCKDIEYIAQNPVGISLDFL